MLESKEKKAHFETLRTANFLFQLSNMAELIQRSECAQKLAPEAATVVRYWLAVSDSQLRLEKMHELMLGEGFVKRKHATAQHWHDWLAVSDKKLSGLSDEYKNGSS